MILKFRAWAQSKVSILNGACSCTSRYYSETLTNSKETLQYSIVWTLETVHFWSCKTFILVLWSGVYKYDRLVSFATRILVYILEKKESSQVHKLLFEKYVHSQGRSTDSSQSLANHHFHVLYTRDFFIFYLRPKIKYFGAIWIQKCSNLN